MRLQNLTFGYTLPVALGNRIGIKNMRIYTSVNNLFVLTGYKGLDPEVSGDDIVKQGDVTLVPGCRHQYVPPPTDIFAGT